MRAIFPIKFDDNQSSTDNPTTGLNNDKTKPFAGLSDANKNEHILKTIDITGINVVGERHNAVCGNNICFELSKIFVLRSC